MLKGLGKYRVQGRVNGVKKLSVVSGMVPQPSNSAGGAQTQMSSTLGQFMKPLLDGMVDTNNSAGMRAMYEDIYYHDAVCGTAVDLISQITFSPYSLSGLPSQQMTDTYADSCEALQTPTLFPELTVDYLVKGEAISGFNFDNDKGRVTSIMPYDPNNCTITPVPIYGRDPIIDLQVPSKMKELVTRAKKDQRLQYILNQYGEDMLEMMNAKSYPLDPKYTLYIPRRTFSNATTGNSYYRRVIPAWLLEKALMRGTIDMAYRRQKSILQIIAGSDEWEPTNEQLSQLVNMFLAADSDPSGAIIATRPDINTTELRGADGLWKIDDSYSFITEMKLRALHISEQFITGEAVLTTMDTTLSVLLEDIRSYREMITRKVFYYKIFPIIAKENNFLITDKKFEIAGSKDSIDWQAIANASYSGNSYFDPVTAQITRNIGNSHLVKAFDNDDQEIDIRKYYIPKITWHKSLKPEADSAYLEILNAMGEKGMPITLRMLAAVGGINLPDIMASLEDDIKVRNKVKNYQDRLPKSPQEQADAMFGNMASLALDKNPDLAPVIANMWKEHRAKPIKKNRDFTQINESQRDPDTKKILSRKGRTVLAERINKHGASILAKHAARENEINKQAVSYIPKNRKTTIFGKI